MISHVATKYGDSFKGVSAYVLHDKRSEEQIAAGVGRDMDTDGQSRERVEWTQTRNLATNDPDVAWKVMSASYMDRRRRMDEHGFAKSGRKNKGPVAHISFSWHPEEKELLRPDEMRAFAHLALKRMGFQELQTLIVCHNDEDHPHIHLVINRAHPVTGKMVNCYYDQNKLSKLALKYERDRGKVFCKMREQREAARKREQQKPKDQRIAIRDDSDPRNIHDLKMQVANDNSRTAAMLKEQRRRAGELKRLQEKLRARRQEEWKAFEADHKQRLADIRSRATQAIREANRLIHERYVPEWGSLKAKHDLEHAQFAEAEKTAVGKIKHVIGSIDFRGLMKLYHEDRKADSRAATMREVFTIMGNAGARLRVEEARHEREERELAKRQQAEELTAKKQAKDAEHAGTQQQRELYLANRSSLILRHQVEAAELKAKWAGHTAHWKKVWEAEKSAAPEAARGPQTPSDDTKLVQEVEGLIGTPTRSATKPEDLTPEEGSIEAAKAIDSEKARVSRFEELMRQKQEKEAENDRGDEGY